MPEGHNILQENATPSAAPTLASSELPSVGSIFTGSGNIRAKACGSAPCRRVVLAALASFTAIALLVFLCSRAYNRRVLHDLRIRRLADAEESVTSVESCSRSGGEEEHGELSRPHTRRAPEDNESHLPFKKRKVARSAEAGVGASRRYAQQYQQRQQHYGPSPFQVPSHLDDIPRPRDPNEAAELLDRPDQPGDGYLTGTRQVAPLEVRQLQRQVRQLQRRLHRLEQMQLEVLEDRVSREQQRGYYQLEYPYHPEAYPQQLVYWQGLLWQQQQQQQSLLMPQEQLQDNLAQQQWRQHLIRRQEWLQFLQQQHLLKQQQQHSSISQLGPQHGFHDQQQQQGVKQKERKLREEESEQHDQETERRQGAELQQGEGEQLKLLPLAHPVEGAFVDDEWIEPDNTRPGMPQPSIYQQELQAYATASPAGPSAADHFILQVSPESSVSPHTVSPAEADAGTSRDGSDGTTAEGVATSKAAAAWAGSVPPAAELETTGEATGSEASIVSDQSSKAISTEAETAGTTAAVTPTGSRELAHDSAPASSVQPADLAATMQHPFVRLPELPVEGIPDYVRVDLHGALNTPFGKRNPMPLLQRAFRLLSRPTLALNQVKQLVAVAEDLIGHAKDHQGTDVSRQQTYRAVERLAVRFLVLDAVVATLLVLKQPVQDTLWREFADSINHIAPTPTRRGMYAGRPTFFTSLAQKLSRAIRTLKKGRRPNPVELLKIKRMLFCSSYSPSRFKEEDFDCWRDADMPLTGAP